MSERRKRSIEVPGVSHGKAPIPMGARVGNIIYSSAIAGKDPATNQLPADPDDQPRLAFANMATLLERGGASLEDVVRVTVLLKDDSLRDAINTEWLRYFPDPEDRPARHVSPTELQHGMLLQLEVVAVVQA